MLPLSKIPAASAPRSMRCRGYALVAVILIAGLVVALLLALLGMGIHGYERLAQTRAQEEARANARLALKVAIAQIQEQLGPDQRVSAPAAVLDAPSHPIAQPHWTGVWRTRGPEGQPLVERDDSSGGLVDRRMAKDWDRAKEVSVWLVSGSEGGGAAPPSPARALAAADAVPLVADGSLGAGAPDQEKVRAPKVRVNSNRTGHYAYWVGDLGTKANIATPDAFEGKRPNPGQPANGGYFRLMASQQAETRFFPGDGRGVAVGAVTRRRLVTDKALQVAAGRATTSWLPRLFHDLTVDSEGVLADARDGGLKRDLTAYLLSAGQIPVLGDLPGLSDNDRLVGPANPVAATRAGEDWGALRHRATAPRFGLLRRWARENAAFSGRDTAAAPPKVEPAPRIANVNDLALANFQPAAIGSLDTPSLMPVLVEGVFYSTLSWHHTIPTAANPNPPQPFQVRIHVYPRVVLWNPYNVELTVPRTIAMIQGNGRREMWTDGYLPVGNSKLNLSQPISWIWFEGGRNPDFTPVENSLLKSAGYTDPYIGCFYFSLPATTFRPGECLVFSPARAAEYSQPGSALGSTGLEANELTCELPPDQSRNYFISNDELDGGIQFVPTLLVRAGRRVGHRRHPQPERRLPRRVEGAGRTDGGGVRGVRQVAADRDRLGVAAVRRGPRAAHLVGRRRRQAPVQDARRKHRLVPAHPPARQAHPRGRAVALAPRAPVQPRRLRRARAGPFRRRPCSATGTRARPMRSAARGTTWPAACP